MKWTATKKAVERRVSEKPFEAKVPMAIDSILALISVTVMTAAPSVIYFPLGFYPTIKSTFYIFSKFQSDDKHTIISTRNYIKTIIKTQID